MTESNVIDIHTRQKIERVENAENDTIQRFIKRWAKAVKDGRFQSVYVIAIDENNYCDWGMISASELHMALATMILEDIKNELKDQIFGYEDIEDD